MTDSHYFTYLNAVQDWAYCFHRDLFPRGGPYDPFLLADHLGVRVHEIDLKGVDGYVESFGSDYRVFISCRSSIVRRRFTLSHELAHVIFMRTAKKGGIRDSYLVRYRRNGLPTSEFQDEREERLCNAFAEEFLLPTEILRQRDFSSDLRPSDILGIATEFRVSMHAAAVKFSKLFSGHRLVSSLWNLKTPWPVATWWAGAGSWFRKRWLVKSDTTTFEELARICLLERRELTEIWSARGTRKFDIRIRIAPANSKHYAMVVLSPFKPARRLPAEPVERRTPLQLDLFSTQPRAAKTRQAMSFP
jgi:Zn-dependent peptidase ImmA (M78 family)